ncbi:MAG: sigma-54 dependent transcriptional regulator, acetoin dehydrogenase operon transcriptional, partial [Myxococcales bacterium]|nr:sigma-54 dependent transcriptional regulator, acetoin dehydrogenase operon transcriptional [Myxococcales bacterium]
LESQLFGHVKGAFSGAARDEVGLVRASDRGTLFLDEIGDMRAPSQVALLRLLQEREVTPVGATLPVRVDLRVVAATHRPVDALEAGGFRSDLYARVAGYTHRLAPLRERACDLGLLVSDLLRAAANVPPTSPSRSTSRAPCRVMIGRSTCGSSSRRCASACSSRATASFAWPTRRTRSGRRARPDGRNPRPTRPPSRTRSTSRPRTTRGSATP